MRGVAALLAVLLGGCDLYFADESTCGDYEVSGGESCDDGNDFTDDCPYGESCCTVCGSGCYETTSSGPSCGDDVVNGPEACDDGNAVTETCPYDESCAVCNETCQIGL